MSKDVALYFKDGSVITLKDSNVPNATLDKTLTILENKRIWYEISINRKGETTIPQIMQKLYTPETYQMMRNHDFSFGCLFGSDNKTCKDNKCNKCLWTSSLDEYEECAYKKTYNSYREYNDARGNPRYEKTAVKLAKELEEWQ